MSCAVCGSRRPQKLNGVAGHVVPGCRLEIVNFLNDDNRHGGDAVLRGDWILDVGRMKGCRTHERLQSRLAKLQSNSTSRKENPWSIQYN